MVQRIAVSQMIGNSDFLVLLLRAVMTSRTSSESLFTIEHQMVFNIPVLQSIRSISSYCNSSKNLNIV